MSSVQKTYGRTTILANYTEKEILTAEEDRLDEIIIDILEKSSSIHLQNKNDSQYLKAFYYGDQDIKYKEKETRENINNKTVENWAYALIQFKEAYLLGKPIQYVQLNNSGEEEISLLNRFVRYENKKAKDMELYEDVLVCGRGFRYVNKDPDGTEDDAPFELINCDYDKTEVVYSSKLGKEQLLSYIETGMQENYTIVDENGEEVTKTKDYTEYTVYLRDRQLVYSDKSGTLQRIGEPIPLLWGEHIIQEYFINRKRISLIELGKDLFNDINYLESLDKDDMEQFVNAIMVFTNATVTEEDIDAIKSLGAVSINSTEQKRASVDLLQGRLNASDTQTYYNRLLNSLHQILGVPMASDNGTVINGDTGQARLTGQGYTSAGIRAETDETMFGMCDYRTLKVILAICKEANTIKNLKVSDIESKFQRDMSDNLLVKSQGLMNLYACDIPRKYANSIVNLFSDPHAVTEEQQKLFGNQASQQNGKSSNDNSETTSDDNKANEQNNQITNIAQKDEQGQ